MTTPQSSSCCGKKGGVCIVQGNVTHYFTCSVCKEPCDIAPSIKEPPSGGEELIDSLQGGMLPKNKASSSPSDRGSSVPERNRLGEEEIWLEELEGILRFNAEIEAERCNKNPNASVPDYRTIDAGKLPLFYSYIRSLQSKLEDSEKNVIAIDAFRMKEIKELEANLEECKEELASLDSTHQVINDRNKWKAQAEALSQNSESQKQTQDALLKKLEACVGALKQITDERYPDNMKLIANETLSSLSL